MWDASALAEGLRDGEVLSSPPTAHGGKTSELGRWSGMLSFPKYFRTKPPAILHFRFLFHFMALAGVLPRASSTLTAYNNTFSLLLNIFLYYHPHICRDERRTLCDDITYFRLVECPWLFDDHISPTAFYANPPFLLLSKSCQDRTMAPTSPTGTPDPPTCSLLCRPKHV